MLDAELDPAHEEQQTSGRWPRSVCGSRRSPTSDVTKCSGGGEISTVTVSLVCIAAGDAECLADLFPSDADVASGVDGVLHAVSRCFDV